jgi:hypothetical protein
MNTVSRDEEIMILAVDSDIVTTIERCDVGSSSLDAVEKAADRSIRTAWLGDPAFVTALILRGTTSGLAVYAQWRKAYGETQPSDICC